MTPYLNLSIALNKGQWSKVETIAEELKIPYDIVMQYYEEVNEWVKDSFSKR